MSRFHRTDTWSSGDAYEPYVGRWSRLVAREFLGWLGVGPGSRWLDIGCGTGALSQTILEFASPAEVKGIDRTLEFVTYAREHTRDGRADFVVGDAQDLPLKSEAYDAVVSGLVLNFVPQAVAEWARVTRPGGTVAAYVWDYAGEMQMMKYFWDAAAALDPAALELHEGERFPICRPGPLVQLFGSAGLSEVSVRAIEVATLFQDFADYWSPFLGGQGPAPGYVMSLSEEDRLALREEIRARLPFAGDGSIHLSARAWAVRGKA